MRICIPIEFLPHGGGHYFLQLFEGYLQANGWSLTRRVDDQYDVLFTNHWMTPRRVVLKAIRHNPNVRIVQRIDGAAQDYGRDLEADRRQAAVNKFADLTIFQSEYSRLATKIKYPIIQQDGPIIHNPVDVNLFRPANSQAQAARISKIISVTWSTNHLKGAHKIYSVAQANPKVDFLLCGNYPDAPDLPNIRRLDQLDRLELAEALRSAQVLLTFSENEACPNHVLEALASGLPVLYTNSGAMAELVGDCGFPVTEMDFPAQLKKVESDLDTLSVKARTRATEKFNPGLILNRYLETIQIACSRPLRTSSSLRSARAWLDLVPKWN